MDFLNKVVNTPELSACPLVLDFLQFKDPKGFGKSLKNSFDKEKQPKTIPQFSTLTGSLLYSNNPKIKKFTDKYEFYTNSQELLSQKFHALSKRLVSETQ